MRWFGTPAFFDSPVERAAGGEFHLHPHYRMPLPLDPLLVKTQPGLDEFVTEKYAARLGAILGQWSASLLRSPQDVTVFEKFLLPNFAGGSLKPTESRAARSGSIEVNNNKFENTLSLSRQEFLGDLRTAMSQFDRIQTAELQVTRVERTGSDAARKAWQLRTRVRYELVGQGADLHFEQRIGMWELVWESAGADDFRLLNWRTVEETQSLSASLAFFEITPMAFRKSGSPPQLVHGTDYWRTALDAACGIDIYGHNGISVGDIDGDGFDDLYVCQPGGLPNRLFRNRGDGTFEDITEASGVGVIENTACALFVDVYNSGHQDLIVVRSNGPLLFLNDGSGKFHQKRNAFRFANAPQGTFTGAAVADYDRDGWLDIYFCLYIYYQGTNQYKYPSPYFDANNGPPNFMMRNNRDGTFVDVTAEAGLNQNNTRYSFCCAWNDCNRDGCPDLYVVNDFGRKNLYRNNGDGTFTDIAAEAGVEDVGAGMSVCWFDYDNDGADDLYVADMWTAVGERITMQEEFKKNSSAEVRRLYRKHAMGNSLFHNEACAGGAGHGCADGQDGAGTARFTDRTDAGNVRIGRWAWSSDSWDFDHDGFPDLYVTNGMVSAPDRDDLNSFFWRQVVAKSPDGARPSQDYEQGWGAINELIRADRTWSGYERNIFYANNGDGTFSDISGVAGLDFMEDGRSFALADFDLDGRQEICLKNRNAPQLQLLHNVLPNLPPSIAFRLRGTKSNRDAIGAMITIEAGEAQPGAEPQDDGQTQQTASLGRHRTQTRSLQAGSGFLAQHSKDVFFGLGDGKGTVKAAIRWPSGLVQEFRDLPVNHRVWIEEGAAQLVRTEAFRPTPKQGWFGQSMPRAWSLDGVQLGPLEIETWLLAPIAAPDFSLAGVKLSAFHGKRVLLHFGAIGDERTERDWTSFNQRAAEWKAQGLEIISINFNEDTGADKLGGRHFAFPVLQGNDDIAAIYNILFRQVFDRHRDLDLPTSFLINAEGEIVKIYQGAADPVHVESDFRSIPKNAAERLARALPFPGVTEVSEFGRNYLSFGSVYFQRGYLDEAAGAFQVALRDDPESAEALYGIGSVYLNQQKNDEARECFDRALKLRATYPDTLANCWNNLGLLAGREGRIDEAVGDFKEALRLSPDHVIAMNNLGSAYRQSKSWSEAETTYKRALAIKPADAEANYGLGMVYAQEDDAAQAESYLKQALKARPGYPEALNNLGILYLRTKRRDEAVASFEACMRAAPDFEQAYVNLARVHLIEGEREKARAVLGELLRRQPKNAAALQMLAGLGK